MEYLETRGAACVRLDHLSSVGPPGRLFRGGFEDVEREGRGDGPVVGTVWRIDRVAKELAWKASKA